MSETSTAEPTQRTYEDQNRYPVIVEETTRYVIWVEADNATEAATIPDWDVLPEPENCYLAERVVRTPDEWDLKDIQEPSDHGWRGTVADAHVQSHRNHLAYLRQEERTAACVAAGHPVPDGARGPLRWADYCGTCGPIDPASRTAVAHV